MFCYDINLVEIYYSSLDTVFYRVALTVVLGVDTVMMSLSFSLLSKLVQMLKICHLTNGKKDSSNYVMSQEKISVLFYMLAPWYSYTQLRILSIKRILCLWRTSNTPIPKHIDVLQSMSFHTILPFHVHLRTILVLQWNCCL